MDEGERLCRRYSERANAAKPNAQQAENEIAAFFAVAEEFEAVAVELVRIAELTGKLSKRVIGEVQSLTAEIHDLDSSIAATAQDPGC